MKSIFTKEVKIALAAICAIILLFYGINFLKGSNPFKKHNMYYVNFHDVTGLQVSNPVYTNGFPVGIVRDIDYDYDLRVFPDGAYKILDKSEYEYHKKIMNYPDEIDKIVDIDTLREMLTFIVNKNGRAEAEEGYHDDLTMALAIAYYIRPQQAMKKIKTENEQLDENIFKEFGQDDEYIEDDYGSQIEVF